VYIQERAVQGKGAPVTFFSVGTLFWSLYYKHWHQHKPVTLAAQSKAWTVFARSEAGIVGSNPNQGMDVWCGYAFILCLCCPVFRYRPCDGLITRPMSPTIYEKWLRNWIRVQGPKWAGRAIAKKLYRHTGIIPALKPRFSQRSLWAIQSSEL
jgi:hypothetical protein